MGSVRNGRSPASVEVLSPLGLPVGTQVGAWRVEGPLGRGGFGAVYRVREATCATGPLYALKLAQAPEDAGFGREAEALRRVKNPGVVRLVEAGRWKAGTVGYPFLVLEYAPGEGLYRWAKVRNPCARQVAGLLLQVAEALEAAHRVGVLHRDFKGSNVVVRPDGRVLVLDWGAGIYPEAAPLTRTGRIPQGTPRYYSPQVVRWRARAARGGGGRYPYTVADEQYAVGVTFYRVLADEYPPLLLPGEEGGLESLELEALVPRPLAALNPRVPALLGALIMRLLAPQPEARFASMAALAEAARRVLAEADAAWETPLFEWYSGPDSQSCTTAEEGPWGPVAPGQEKALLRDRYLHLDAQADKAAARWVRRRHPQALPPHQETAPLEPAGVNGPLHLPRPTLAQVRAPAQAQASSQAPPAQPGVPRPVPDSRREGMRARLLLAGVALLGTLTLAGAGLREVLSMPQVLAPAARATADGKVASSGTPPHAAAPPAGVSPPTPPTHSQEEAMPPARPTSTGTSGMAATLKRGVVAGCTAALAGCSGVQVRPTTNAPCPEGALEAMKKLHLTEGMQIDIYVDKNRRNNEPVFLKDGPIESRVFDSRTLPDDSLVRGRLWTKGQTVIGRYTELELPNGRLYPVCLVLCDEDGCTKDRESTPEQAALPGALFFMVVDVFP